MKQVILGIAIGLVVGAGATYLLSKPSAPTDKAETKETKSEEKPEASFVHHATNGETYLKLDLAAQKRMGLIVAPLASAQLRPEVKGYGRVLDPTQLAGLWAERAATQAALEASTKEYERLKALRAQDQNASARALEAAEAAMKRDRIQLDSVGPRIVLGWGQAIASDPDLGSLIERLAMRKAALVRVDLPLDRTPKEPPTGARIAGINSPEQLLEGHYLGAAPSVDPQLQSLGFLFVVATETLAPGAAVTGWLALPGEPENGVLVPRVAVLRHEGETFVYLQTGADTFQRRAIELVRPLAEGWFASEGLKAGDKLVVVAAQELLSDELKGQGGE